MIKHKAAPPYLLKFVELLSQNPMVTVRARQSGKPTIHNLRRAATPALDNGKVPPECSPLGFGSSASSFACFDRGQSGKQADC